MNVVLSADSKAARKKTRHHTILSCPDCARLTILEHTEPGMRDDLIRVSPESLEESSVVKHLPEDVAKYFGDARRAIDADIPDAAAVQLRRTLEAAAKNRGIQEKVLFRSIEKLIADGHVTSSFSGALDHVRVVGNQGAHAGDESVSEAQAEQAYRFTTQLLRNLFEVPGELDLLAKESNDSVE
ncbi:DUF4145 domain-containing protein (plasmid) [Rhodococcus qingshengii]|uniref:DUF4145 domain-containing protein n=1 Tax=Rhodococcus qingshengii TaxID=334542 RepID=UPI0021132C04|nr:DUF4145 domain-containing protein [Rhodococcus qingshengii]UUE28487.1 DUF4145 domain-containing protein [Rhodococcus qingshengii]